MFYNIIQKFLSIFDWQLCDMVFLPFGNVKVKNWLT